MYSNYITTCYNSIEHYSLDFLENINNIPAFPDKTNAYLFSQLNEKGLVGEKTLEEFRQRFYKGIVSSGGSRYFGFVTGGVTPVALMGDWLVSAFDQNATVCDYSSVAKIEEEAINIEALENYLKELNREPCIVVANVGTVNTVDFDDLK